MPRSEAGFARRIEPNRAASQVENDDEAGPVIVPIHKAERTFRWLSGFRNEPRFELAPVGNPAGEDGPDRAA